MDNTQFGTAVILLKILSQVGSTIASAVIATGSLDLENEEKNLHTQLIGFEGGLLVRVLANGIPVANPTVIPGEFDPKEKFSAEAQLYIVPHPPVEEEGQGQ